MTIESSSNDRNGIQVIARAAAVLRAIESEPSGLSLGELAVRLDLARSTVQRIVGALIEEGLLISAGARNGVTLGPALTRLAAAAIVDTERMVRPVLQELSSACGETVDLSVLQGNRAVFVDQIMGNSRLVAVSAVGEAFPLHCTANGKALLSCVSPERRLKLLGNRLRPHTDATITDVRVIEAQIADCQIHGVAWDLEEHAEGICAVGTAFVDPLGRDFALSIPVPVARFPRKKNELAQQVLAARDEIVRLVPGSRTASDK